MCYYLLEYRIKGNSLATDSKMPEGGRGGALYILQQCLLGTVCASCCNRLKMKCKLINLIISSTFVEAVLRDGHL